MNKTPFEILLDRFLDEKVSHAAAVVRYESDADRDYQTITNLRAEANNLKDDLVRVRADREKAERQVETLEKQISALNSRLPAPDVTAEYVAERVLAFALTANRGDYKGKRISAIKAIREIVWGLPSKDGYGNIGLQFTKELVELPENRWIWESTPGGEHAVEGVTDVGDVSEYAILTKAEDVCRALRGDDNTDDFDAALDEALRSLSHLKKFL